MFAHSLRTATGAAVALTAGLVIAACGGSSESPSSDHGMMTMANGMVMPASQMAHSAKKHSASAAGMSGMHVDVSVPSVNGQHPVASQVLATADWQGMEIQARTMTPIRFILFSGTKERIQQPSKHASFHLMVMLNDQRTNEPIPYSSVWATITPADEGAKVAYSDNQWQMISAFMGPHYGNDVPRLAPGRYKLTLLISPPVAARTAGYEHVWLHPHTVVRYFNWNGHAVVGGAKTGMSKSAMSGSSMSANSMSAMDPNTNVAEVNGQKRPATRTLASSTWQGMKIQSLAAAPAPFALYNGTSETVKSPPRGANLDLIVSLSDEHTHQLIPYAKVFSTIASSAGKVVYRGKQVPTISPFDGVQYASDLALPSGHYTLTLRIDPPVAARHVEYQHVWLHPHTVVEHFTWDPGKSAT